MRNVNFRVLIWVLPTMLFIMAAFWGLSRAISEILVFIQTGSDPGEALNIVPNKPIDWPVELTWTEDVSDTGRRLDPFTREQIEAVYLNAWLQAALSHEKGEPFNLGTFYGGPALAAMEDAVEIGAANGQTIQQINTHHELRLNFYAADGSVVAFTDQDARITRLVRDADGNTIFADEVRDTYDVVMIIDNEKWRIRHILRTGEGPQSEAVIRATVDPNPVAGINYYPAETPWELFWEEYDVVSINRDLNLMKSLGLNTVRIFIPYEQFGGSNLETIYVFKLEDFLNQAEAHDIKVIVTLFDFASDYALLRWPRTDNHMVTLLEQFADNDTISAWDIKNEPDRDYPAHGKDLVDLWLRHKLELAREADPDTPLTIGWSTVPAAMALTDAVDIVSFHFYGRADDFSAELDQLRTVSGDKPLVLQEFGLPTWNSWLFPNGHTENEQAEYYADILEIARAEELDGYIGWTLYDFPEVPANVAGGRPWETGPQQQLGIFKADGTPKVAAPLISPNANLSLAPTVTTWERFTKPFWRTVFVAALISFRLAFWLVGVMHRVLTRQRQTT